MREQIKQQMREAINNYVGYFHSEKDLQLYITQYLINTGNYDNVFMEYYVSIELIPNYLWGNENKISVDIVVEKNDLFYPIELKFKTTNQELPYFVFGEESNMTLENHGAQTIGRYDFWKDVKRIEFLEETFERVKRGVVLFVSNDAAYRNQPRDNDGGTPFSIYDERNIVGGTLLEWGGDLVVADGRPGFRVKYDYEIIWQQMNIENHSYFLI